MLRFQLGDTFTLDELHAISAGSFVWNDMNVFDSVEADGRTTVCFWPARWTSAAGRHAPFLDEPGLWRGDPAAS